MNVFGLLTGWVRATHRCRDHSKTAASATSHPGMSDSRKLEPWSCPHNMQAASQAEESVSSTVLIAYKSWEAGDITNQVSSRDFLSFMSCLPLQS